MRALGVIARQPHRLHDRFGAGHVEGDFVEPGNLAQPLHIVGDGGVVGAEHRPERMGARLTLGDALLVEVVAEDIDTVGAGEIVENIAVDIGYGNAGRGFHEGAGAEIFLHQAAVLERHPVGASELQVGYPAGGFRRHGPALGVAILVKASKPEEAVLALGGNRCGRAVGAEEIVDVEFVVRDQLGGRTRHLGMPGERAVLRAGERQPGTQFREDRGGGRCGRSEGENQSGRIHAKIAIQSC